jgi:hypothetical protein
MIDQLKERGYNEGAARYIVDQIKAGHGTLDQWLFSALNLNKVKKLNEEHVDYAAKAAQEVTRAATSTTVSATVRPNGSFSNYLAIGHVTESGEFKRAGYPKDYLKPQYGGSSGKRGGNQYEYDVSFQVPAEFPFYIVQVYNASAVQNKSFKVLYTPKVRS